MRGACLGDHTLRLTVIADYRTPPCLRKLGNMSARLCASSSMPDPQGPAPPVLLVASLGVTQPTNQGLDVVNVASVVASRGVTQLMTIVWNVVASRGVAQLNKEGLNMVNHNAIPVLRGWFNAHFAGPTGGYNCGKPCVYGEITCTGTHFRSQLISSDRAGIQSI